MCVADDVDDLACSGEDDDGVSDDFDVVRQRAFLLGGQLWVVDIERDAERKGGG